MSDEAAMEPLTRLSARVAGQQRRSRFFAGMAGLLLLLVVTGFLPTLHARPLFELRPMPMYLYVHGGVLTAWFVLLLLQTSLISGNRPDMHRRVGVGGAVLAVLVVGGGLMAQLGKGPRLRAMGVDTTLGVIPDAAVFWGNLWSLVIFGSFVLAAILLRGRAETHKRLMLLASIGIMGPALARMSRWPLFGGSAFDVAGPLERYFATGGILLLLIVVVVHDVVSRRRVHPATLMGCACIVAARSVPAMIASTESGRALIAHWL